MQDEECAAEEVPAFQDQEEDSDACSETPQDDSVAHVSDAETRLEPQQVIICAHDELECEDTLRSLLCCTS